MRQGGLYHFCELSPTASSLPWFWGCTGTDVKNILKTPLNFLIRKGHGWTQEPPFSDNGDRAASTSTNHSPKFWKSWLFIWKPVIYLLCAQSNAYWLSPYISYQWWSTTLMEKMPLVAIYRHQPTGFTEEFVNRRSNSVARKDHHLTGACAPPSVGLLEGRLQRYPHSISFSLRSCFVHMDAPDKYHELVTFIASY